MVDVNEGYESELAPEFRQRVSGADLQSGGFSTLFLGSADYSHNARRVQFAASGSTAYRHYQRLGRFEPVSHTAGVGATFVLPKRGSLQINQSAAYSPSYFYSLFPTNALFTPGETIPADPDYRINESASQSYATNLNLGFSTSRESRVAFTADYQHTRFDRETSSQFDNTFYTMGANFSRPLSRNVSMTASYQYRTAEYRADQLTREHSGSAGVRYSRPLSRSRRVTYHLDVSPSSLNIPEATLREIAEREGTQVVLDDRSFRFQVEGGVDYDFRPNWTFSGSYRRGVEYLAILTEPVFVDAARIGLNGLITQRLDLSSSAGYATGESTIATTGDGLKTYTGNIRLRYAINRPFAVYSEYVYYQYDLRDQAQIGPALPSAFKQQVIRIGVMFFTSLGT